MSSAPLKETIDFGLASLLSHVDELMSLTVLPRSRLTFLQTCATSQVLRERQPTERLLPKLGVRFQLTRLLQAQFNLINGQKELKGSANQPGLCLLGAFQCLLEPIKITISSGFIVSRFIWPICNFARELLNASFARANF